MPGVALISLETVCGAYHRHRDGSSVLGQMAPTGDDGSGAATVNRLHYKNYSIFLPASVTVFQPHENDIHIVIVSCIHNTVSPSQLMSSNPTMSAMKQINRSTCTLFHCLPLRERHDIIELKYTY